MSNAGICTLSEIAEIGLGFKSLQNSFFYVTKDVIEAFGIEKKFLRPIFMMKDLKPESYFQPSKSSQWVFICRESEPDLKGTGALKYIREMAKRPAAKVKQSGPTGTTIREALEAQGGGFWYGPKAILHQTHIWLRKGFNTAFNPFLFEAAAAVDQRCNFLIPKEGIEWEVLAALLTSSTFALSAESHGACSMGAGVLELATKPLHDVKIIDPRVLNKDQRAELVNLAQSVWKEGKPNDWSTEKPSEAVQKLDEWLLTRYGKPELQSKIYADLISTCRSRVEIAKDKDKQTKRATGTNLAAVAAGIADAVRPFLESRQFPESFCSKGEELIPFKLPSFISVEIHPMMQDALLVMKNAHGKVLLENQYPQPVAEVILRAVMLGRRSFSVPQSQYCAQAVLKAFDPWMGDIQDRIEEGCRISAIGTKYEAEVRQMVFQNLGVDAKVSAHNATGHFDLHAG